MEENYDELLLAVTKVRNNHKLYKAEFNVLTTFLRPSNEVELHSRFISWLLDPRGPHKLGELPLKLFLLQMGSQFTVSNTTKVTPNAINWTEDRDMDILIQGLVNKEGENCAIVIENKIYASDSNHGEDDGQLARYFCQVQKGVKIQNGEIVDDKKTYFQCEEVKNIELYYLTPDGHKPSGLTFQNEVTLEMENDGDQDRVKKIRLLKYNEQIVKWLDEVLQTTNPSPLVEELILEYKDALYCVSPNSKQNDELAQIFENNNLRKKLMDFIKAYESLESLSLDKRGDVLREKFKDDSLVDAVLFLLTNYRHIYWHALNDFFIKLQDELHTIFGDDLLPREIDKNTSKEKTIDKYVSEIVFEDINASKKAPMYYRIRLKNREEWTLQPNRAKGFFLGLDKKQINDSEGWEMEIYLDKEGHLPLLKLWDFTNDDNTFDLLNEEERKNIARQYAAFVKQELKNFDETNS